MLCVFSVFYSRVSPKRPHLALLALEHTRERKLYSLSSPLPILQQCPLPRCYSLNGISASKAPTALRRLNAPILLMPLLPLSS